MLYLGPLITPFVNILRLKGVLALEFLESKRSNPLDQLYGIDHKLLVKFDQCFLNKNYHQYSENLYVKQESADRYSLVDRIKSGPQIWLVHVRCHRSGPLLVAQPEHFYVR